MPWLLASPRDRLLAEDAYERHIARCAQPVRVLRRAVALRADVPQSVAKDDERSTAVARLPARNQRNVARYTTVGNWS